MTVKELVEKLKSMDPSKEVIVLVGIYWGDLKIVERMGDTVILEADKKNILEK